jgi:CDP-diacylglycerol--serine O-phosphatidyltransferase
MVGSFTLAAWCILWCVLLDKLDGTLARLLRAQSRFGVEYDSFADFCAFGFAPAALVSQYVLARPGWVEVGGVRTAALSAAAFYVVMAAVRLARYNVETSAVGDRLFFGVPSTMSGGLIASGFLVATRHLTGPDAAWPPLAAAGILVLLGLLMISRFPLPKLRVRRSRWFNYFQAANIVAAYTLAALMMFPEFLFAQGFSYIAVGMFFGHRTARAIRAEERDLCGEGQG